MPFEHPCTPANPGYEALCRASLARQQHMTTLGVRLTHLAPGEADLSAPFDLRFTQQNGFWHAGAVASLADSANGYAAFTLAPAGTDVLAVEFKINLLAPARGDGFRAAGRVLRPGRTITSCLADVYASEAGQERLIATMLSTLIIRPMRRATYEPAA